MVESGKPIEGIVAHIRFNIYVIKIRKKVELWF